MLAKRPADRYQSMAALLEELEPVLEALGGVQHGPASVSRAAAKSKEPDTKALDLPRTTQFNRPQDAETAAAMNDNTTLEPPSRSAPAVGIDLGTTYSAVAFLDSAGRPLVLSNAEGDKTTPSVVLLDDGDVIVGKEAAKAMATDMESIAECAKRDLGLKLFRKTVGGEEFPPR